MFLGAYHVSSQDAFRSLEPVVGKMVHSVSFSTTGGQAWPWCVVGLNAYVGIWNVPAHFRLIYLTLWERKLCVPIKKMHVMIGFVWNFILWKSVRWPFGLWNLSPSLNEIFHPMQGPHRLLRCVSANLRPRRCLSSILAHLWRKLLTANTHASIGMFRIFRLL